MKDKLLVTFLDAGPEMKLLLLILWAAAAACAGLWAAQAIRPGPMAAAGLEGLRRWRMGGPLLGLTGVSYLAMNDFVAIHRLGMPSMRVLAPGLAEIALVLGSGLLAGALATLACAQAPGAQARGGVGAAS